MNISMIKAIHSESPWFKSVDIPGGPWKPGGPARPGRDTPGGPGGPISVADNSVSWSDKNK